MTEDYYNDPKQWGNSLPSLKDIIDEVILDAEEQSSVFRNYSREAFIRYAKRGLSMLNYKIKDNIKGVEITVPCSLFFPLFEDFTSLVRASVIECGELFPIYENKDLPNSIERYMQQCCGEVVFDCNGQVYTIGDSLNCKHGCTTDSCNECVDLCFVDPCTQKANKYKDEYIKLLKDPHRFGFSDGLEDKQILIEYLSNGLVYSLDECSIRLKEEWTEMLIHFIKWKCLEHNVQYFQLSQYHKQQFTILKSNVIQNDLEVDYDAILKILRA